MEQAKSGRGGARGSTIASVIWGVFAFGTVAAMIGLAPARSNGADTPSAMHATPFSMSDISWTDGECNRCHTPDETFSHPVGFRPQRSLPAEFPLQDGVMTCLTCHDGSDSALHAQARMEGTPMLRSALEGPAFCAQCHEGDSLSGGSHALAVSKAHLVWPDERPDRDVRNAIEGLDRESASCLECHDGTFAMGVAGRHSGDLFQFGARQEHPVGIPYSENRDQRGMRRMVNPHSLDPRIRLFDGTVGCNSCHSVYSPLDAKLVMSNKGSALCLSCHDG